MRNRLFRKGQLNIQILLLLMVICGFSSMNAGFAQICEGNWVDRGSLPTGINNGRGFPSFAIGGKVYIGDESNFWEYDPSTTTWTQKTAIGTINTSEQFLQGVGFAIASQNAGYFVSGESIHKETWKYDVTNDTWSQVDDFGGVGRKNAVAFVIGDKAYVGTGTDVSGITFYDDFWEYDPVNDTWTQKSAFGGSKRGSAVGFALGNKGYVGTGRDLNGNTNDFWEYDPGTDTWTQKTAFAGTARREAVGFSLGNQGFIGTGFDGANYYKDMWRYNPNTNSWKQVDDQAVVTSEALGVVAGNQAYVGGGYNGTSLLSGFREYVVNEGVWTDVADVPSVTTPSISFTIGNKAYLCQLNPFSSTREFWEYNSVTDSWTARKSFPGQGRYGASAFVVNGKGYIGLGANGSLTAALKDVWEYDPATDIWTQKNDFSGTARIRAASFVINGTAYVGTGEDLNVTALNDFWKYDQASDSWTSITSLPGTTRSGAFAFAIGNRGYLGAGTGSLKDVWEYNPDTNAWTQKSDFSGSSGGFSQAFTINNKGYVIEYSSGATWEYDLVNDSWTLRDNYPESFIETAFSVNGKGYGVDNSNTVWAYVPCDGCTGSVITYDNNAIVPFETKASDYIAFGNIDGNAIGQVLAITTSNQTVTLQAANYVDFVEGTDISVDANTGNYVDAVIQDCDANSSSSRITRQPINVTNQASLQESLQVNLFPNPTQGRVNVEVKAGETSSIRVTVINLKGEVVKVLEDTGAQSQTFPVDLSNQPKGIYLVKVTTDKGSVVKRVVVN